MIRRREITVVKRNQVLLRRVNLGFFTLHPTKSISAINFTRNPNFPQHDLLRNPNSPRPFNCIDSAPTHN
ncbi:hypothetical protein AKJ16_DCAP03150 [Drosera capensis]